MFYQDICLFKKSATTAYNKHVQKPLAWTATLTYKHFLKSHGQSNDLKDLDDNNSDNTPAPD